jgi:RNA polymerase sigma-70 factor (ECF subfamily)
MHAVAEAGPAQSGLAPGGVCVMTQPRSGGRWQSLDGGRSANDDAVIPRQAPRHEAAPNSPSHEDTLVRMLYEEHAGPLLMFVLRLTGGDRQRAEDIVQETLLRAWRNAHRLGAQGQQSLRPWLVTVARRIAIDDHRSASARPAETYDRELESFPSQADDTDRVLQSMTVSDALRELSQSHREILIETYFRGRTVPEAAEVLNLPLGTAKSRVYYALRALRTALQQRGVTE